LAYDIYNKDTTSPYSFLTDEHKQILLNSYLNELIKKHLESNLLWYGRVSQQADDSWYHRVKASSDYSERRKEIIDE
jgi:hypothetical protein